MDKLSMLVSTIRLPAPFSERQTELLLLQLNQAFWTLPVQTSDFTGKVGLPAALVVSFEVVSAAAFEAKTKH